MGNKVIIIAKMMEKINKCGLPLKFTASLLLLQSAIEFFTTKTQPQLPLLVLLFKNFLLYLHPETDAEHTEKDRELYEEPAERKRKWEDQHPFRA